MKFNQNLLADIFQDGMVFPRNKDFKVGGYIAPKQKVEVNFNQHAYFATSDENGKWKITLPSVNDDIVNSLTVKSNNKTQTISNLKFGRVDRKSVV